jgi:hypothetical protein
MPKTNAERQRAWRQRQAGRIAALEAEAAELRAEASALRADLAAALAEAERLTAAACTHPAGAVDSGTCRACGSEVWSPGPATSPARKRGSAALAAGAPGHRPAFVYGMQS